MPKLRKDHIEYLTKRGVETELLANNYFSDGFHLGICYLDPDGNPYKDSKGNIQMLLARSDYKVNSQDC